MLEFRFHEVFGKTHRNNKGHKRYYTDVSFTHKCIHKGCGPYPNIAKKKESAFISISIFL